MGIFDRWLGRESPGDGASAAQPGRTPAKWLPVIDVDYCTGCGLCAAACAHGCLGLEWSFARLQRPDLCRSDGACVSACPEGLIRMNWASAPGDPEIGRWREAG